MINQETDLQKKTLNILSDAISDVGSWQWWYTAADMFQLEFCDVMLYDEITPEKGPHTNMIALRFCDNAFAVFLDSLQAEQGKPWHDRFHDDEIQILRQEHGTSFQGLFRIGITDLKCQVHQSI